MLIFLRRNLISAVSALNVNVMMRFECDIWLSSIIESERLRSILASQSRLEIPHFTPVITISTASSRQFHCSSEQQHNSLFILITRGAHVLTVGILVFSAMLLCGTVHSIRAVQPGPVCRLQTMQNTDGTDRRGPQHYCSAQPGPATAHLPGDGRPASSPLWATTPCVSGNKTKVRDLNIRSCYRFI